MKNETHLSTQQKEASDHMRIPQKNENSQGAPGHQPPPPPRTQKADHSVNFSLPKAARLLVKRQYQRILKTGTKHVGSLVTIDYRSSKGSRPKLGITVSRRYGKAHLRNRFKRVVREAFRHCAKNLPADIEINVVPRMPFQKISRDAIMQEFDQLALKCRKHTHT